MELQIGEHILGCKFGVGGLIDGIKNRFKESKVSEGHFDLFPSAL